MVRARWVVAGGRCCWVLVGAACWCAAPACLQPLICPPAAAKLPCRHPSLPPPPYLPPPLPAANVPEVITVSASNVASKYNGTRAGDPEDMYKWSNTGPCIDIFAPGVDIFSACGGPSRCESVDDRAYTYASGTSMAVPHVAGGWVVGAGWQVLGSRAAAAGVGVLFVILLPAVQLELLLPAPTCPPATPSPLPPSFSWRRCGCRLPCRPPGCPSPRGLCCPHLCCHPEQGH